jgi:hypothetical protein
MTFFQGKQIQRGADVLDLHLRGLGLGAAQLLENLKDSF